MSNKSNFLKQLLTTASVVAVVANAGQAFAGQARLVTGAATAAGVNMDQNNVPADVPVVAGSTITFRAADSFAAPIGAFAIAAIQMDTNTTTATLNANVGGSAVTIGPITRAAGKTGAVNITGNAGAASVFTLTGIASPALGYIVNPVAPPNWAFAAAANDYSGLGNVTFVNAGDQLVIQSAAVTLNGTINGNGGNQGKIVVDAVGVVFKGIIGAGANKVGALEINDGKSATLNENATFNTAITVGNGSSLTVAAGKTIAAATLDGSVANVGSLIFSGASTSSITKLGDTKTVNLVQVGAGEVNFNTTTDYKATTTKLTDATSAIKFSKAAIVNIEGDFTTTIDGKGKVIFDGNDRTVTGSIGAAGASFEAVHIGSDHQISFKKDSGKVYAGAITTQTTGKGSVLINGDNFEINSDIGVAGTALKQVQFSNNQAGTGDSTIKLMAGKKIYANKVNFAAALGATQVTLELYDGTAINQELISLTDGKGIVSVKGNTTITGGINKNIAGLNELIDIIRFDTANSLTLNKNLAKTTNGIDFQADGSLILTENESFDFDKTIKVKVDVNGMGSITANNAVAGKTLTFTGPIGDNAAANTSLKLLEATGGANIKLSNANIAIKKINVGAADMTLILDKAAGKYLINEFVHENGKSTVAVSENITLVSGTSLSDANHRLKAISFDDDRTLTIGDGVNLYAVNDLNGGIRNAAAGKGTLVFEGDSTIGAIVGLNNAFKAIQVQGANKTVTFEEKVNLVGDMDIFANATAVLKDAITAGNIKGKLVNNGTLRFENQVAFSDANSINVAIGATKLNIVEIAGADITFKNATFDTNTLAFTGNNAATVTFEAIAANNFQNTAITTTGNGIHNIILPAGKNQQFDQAVGTAANPFGYLRFSGDDTITLNGEFHGSVMTKTDKEGRLDISNPNTIVTNLGSNGTELKAVNFKAATTVAGNVFSKNITVEAGQTATLKGIVSSSSGFEIQDGSTAAFSGPNVILDTIINAANAGQGIARFDDSVTIIRSIGETKNLQLIAFDGAGENKVAEVDSDLFATNITVAARTWRATDDVRLNGSAAFNGSVLDLNTHDVTFENGNSTFTGNMTVALELDENKKSGKIIVDGSKGAANLNPNATALILKITDKALLPKTTETYDLVTTSNGGTFNAFNIPSSINATNNRFVKWERNGAQLTRSNNAQQALLDITGSKEISDTYGNISNVGEALAYVSEVAQFPDDGTRKDSLQRITESTAVHATNIISENTSSVNAGINNRIGALSNHPQPGIQTSSTGPIGVAAGDGDFRYGAWLSPFYNTAIQKAQSNRAGYRQQSFGATIGVDTQANADMTIGIAGSFVRTDVKHKNFKSGDKTKVNTLMLSIYGVQQLTNEWFLQGYASFSTSKIKNTEKRVALSGTQKASGSFDSTSYGAELLAGYNHSMSQAVITPLIGAGFTRINNGSYKETGTTNQNLSVSMKASNKFEGILGLRAEMNTKMEAIDLTPELHAFVRHDFVGKNAKVTTTHSGLVNQATPKQAKVQKTTFNVGVALNAVSGMYEYGAGYDLFATNKFMSHQGSLKLRVNF